MKLFIDTANLEEIIQANDMGVICGVTTNPSLIVKEGLLFSNVIKSICRIIDGPISAEVIDTMAEGMVAEALEIVKWSDNVVIKLPMTKEGLKATKILSSKGIKTNLTLVFSANQALLAARAGARYVSPFVGRLDDVGYDGIALIEDIIAIFELHDIKTEVIAASIRHPIHVTQAALAGAHIATIPFKVIEMMAKHPMTDAGIEKFLSDWEKATK